MAQECNKSRFLSAGLYEMPEFFQKINMPSFWMSYISVTDIDHVAKTAKELGGKVELEETNALGKIVLIRDPAGAGFTCYEGVTKSGRAEHPNHGRWYWSELFISDLSQVKEFYTELFGWSFKNDKGTTDRHLIYNSEDECISAVQVADDKTKGPKSFWGVFFGVRDAEAALTKIHDAGGKVIYDYSNANGTHYLANDAGNAAFFISDSNSRTEGVKSVSEHSTKTNLKWRSVLGLVGVYLAIFFEANWIWGSLFLIWVIPDLKSGTTYFIEPLHRRQSPILYWAVVLTWLWLSIYLLANTI